LLLFLYESGLIHKDKPVVSLAFANLRHANLRMADLKHANLSDAILNGADLRDAFLWDANLSGANLRDAYLNDARLEGAYEVNDEGDRQPITNERLERLTKSLKGATVPDGSKHR
jgi:uncharacterized protein YjbI with pentapeptide repeats